MSIENRSLKLPHSSGVLCGQKRSIFGEGIVYTYILYNIKSQNANEIKYLKQSDYTLFI